MKEIDVEDVKNNLQTKLDELMAELEDLDKEKALKLAKEKGAQLKEKAEDIYNIAKEKGTPVLQKAAKEVKQKTIDVVEEVLRKLKNEDK